mgnify:CR=1 FL=1
MKNYTEITNNLLKRRDRYFAEKKAKNKKILGTVTSICCLIVIALIAVGVLQSENSNSVSPVVSGSDTHNVDKTQAHSDLVTEKETTDNNEITEQAGKNPVNKYNKRPQKYPLAQNGSTTDIFENPTEEGVISNLETSKNSIKNSKDNQEFDKDITENQNTTNNSPKWIEKIVVTRMPDKTVYYLGERFDLRGLQVMGYFTNGEVEDVTEDVQYYSQVASAVSNKYKINIEYTDNSEFINLAYTSINVIVIEPKIEISNSSLTLNTGDKSKLSAYTEATGCSITWHTTDPSVVTIDSNGNVTAVSEGTAAVYAEISYNSYKKASSYCTVTVTPTEA